MKRTSLVEAVQMHRMGATSFSQYRSKVLQAKLEQTYNCNKVALQSTKVSFPEVYSEDDPVIPLECSFVTPINDCFVGAWTKGRYPSCNLYVSPFYCRLHPNGGSSKSDCYSIHTENMEISGVMRNCEIVDICGIDLCSPEISYIMFVARSLNETRTHVQFVPWKYESMLMSQFDSIRLEFDNYICCCSWNAYSKMFGLGTDVGVIVSKLDDAHRLNEAFVCPGGLEERYALPYAIDFNSKGDVLYLGFNDGFVAYSDKRCSHKILHGEQFVGNGITSIKLLGDDATLITSGHNSRLCFVDTRMNSVIFNYAGHFSKQKKIPFHIDESLDVICACGEDYVTRFWNIKQGKFLTELPPIFMRQPGPYVYFATDVRGRELCCHAFTGSEVYCLRRGFY